MVKIPLKLHGGTKSDDQFEKISIVSVFIVMICSGFFLNTAFAGSFNGIFINDRLQPQPDISLEFYSAKTDVLVKRVDADTKGIFRVDTIADGEYKLKIPAYNSIPEQWFASSGNNTRYAQYTLWIGPAMQYDTLKILVTMTPTDNSPTSTVLVQVVDSSGKIIKKTGVELLCSDMRQVGYVYNDTGNVVSFVNVQPGQYTVGVNASPYPHQYYDTLLNSSYADYFFPVALNEQKTISVKMTMLPSGNGQIRGKCYGETSIPAAGLAISLYGINDTLSALYRDTTSDAGDFSFDGILSENYYLKIQGGNYPSQWYSRQRGSTVLYPDDPVWSSPIATTDTMKIFVTALPLNNLPGSVVKIIAYSPEGTVEKIYGKAALVAIPSQHYTTVEIDSAAGMYVSPPVAEGLYGLGFSIPGYPYQFYNPNGNTSQASYQFSLGKNETLMVQTSLKRSFIDTLVVGYGYVSGSVRDSAGVLHSVSVTIFEKSGVMISSSITDSLGEFKPVRVQNELMYLRVDAPGYPPQYWVPSGSILTSGISTINYFSVPTMTTMAADMKVTLNPSVYQDANTLQNQISGTVKSSNGPLAGVRVLLIEGNSTIFNGFSPQHLMSNFVTITDSTGNYLISGFPSGNYLVAAVADTLNYVTHFYKSADYPKNATPVRVDNASVAGITFTLRTGGVLKGIVVDSSTGSVIEGVRINVNENIVNGRHFEVKSRYDGSWEMVGLPSGEYNYFVSSGLFIEAGNTKNSVQVTEGETTVLDPIRLVRGGVVQGSIALKDIELKDTLLWSGHGEIVLFPNVGRIGTPLHPVYRTGVQFSGNFSDNTTKLFVSSVCPTGIFKVAFVPNPVSRVNSSEQTSTETGIRNLAYTFLNGDTSYSTASTITITAGDTSRNNVLELRKGVSVFGVLFPDSATNASVNNYHVNVYKKEGATLLWVASSHPLGNGTFELPGLINGENYLYQLWADGYPDQYWSAIGKNTTGPAEPMVLNIATGKLQLRISKTPEGSPIDMSQYIALMEPLDSNGTVKIKWITLSGSEFDTFFVYTRSNTITKQLLATVPSISGVTSYEWVDKRLMTGWNDYCVTGHSASMVVRSDVQRYDLRQKSVARGGLWIDVSGSRNGIVIEWGLADTGKINESDSVVLFKRAVGASYVRHLSRSARETYLIDWKWSKSDSLKTFEYYIEISSKGLRSAVKPITLDNSFFKLLPKEIRVGPGQNYTSIQRAIDAAGDNDNITVASGLYTEQIHFKGKKLNLHGDWNNGYPPVIDASGGTAITIPFTQSGYDGWIEISGLKITNASTGVFARTNVHINRCLFSNVIKGVNVIPDSCSLASALPVNPFLEKGVQANIDHCTFIASKPQVIAVSVLSSSTSVGSGWTYDRQLLLPLKTFSAVSGIQKSLFSYYGSIGGSSTLPISTSGTSSHVWLENCAAWQTPVQAGSDAVKINGAIVVADPLFRDSEYYLYRDSSKLSALEIGYGVTHKNEEEEKKKPADISNLIIFNRSVNKVELTWSAAPGTDSIVRYRIYRVPGNPSLFYVNSDSLWDLVSSKNSGFPEELDTFSTEKLFFTDSTVAPGQPYLYAVCAVDQYGNESTIRMPALKPITSYFSNTFNYSIPVKADRWMMISPWGKSVIDFGANTTMKLFHWDPQKPADKLLSHYIAVTKMVPGNGYWVKSLKDTTITVSVSEPERLVKVQDTLRCRLSKGGNGWNQISSPFPHKVNPALPSKYVLWEWIVDSSGYKRVSIMEPWKGYWVYTDIDTAFMVNSGNNDVPSKSMLAKRSAHSSWELVLSLKSRSGIDPENVCGVVSSASMLSFGGEIPEPPESFGGNYLYFVKNDTSGSGTSLKKLSYSYIESEAIPVEKIEWPVAIHSPGGASTITVSGIDQCPSDLGVYWIYKGSIVNLRSNPVIIVDSSAKVMYGYLAATANPLTLSLYSTKFMLRTPYPNPSKGRVVVEFVVPYQWAENGVRTGDNGQDVSMVLYDLSGRVVKTLIKSRIATGKHTISWDGKSDKGNRAGSGMYILQFKSGSFVRNVQLYRIR